MIDRPTIRRRRLVRVVELHDFYDPRFIHGLSTRERRELRSDVRTRTVTTDDAPPAGLQWYRVVRVPGLGRRLRLWPWPWGPIEKATARDNFMFLWNVASGSWPDVLALVRAAPESVRARLSPATRALAERLAHHHPVAKADP
jgi:hypothetical protein